MRTKKSEQKKHPKFRLLLDSAFAKPAVFKKLSKKASVEHIRHDFNFAPGTDDKEIYSLASERELIIVTLDLGFKKLVRQNRAGVFMLSSGLSNEEIDKRLTAFISSKDPKDFERKAVKIPIEIESQKIARRATTS